MYVVFIYVSYMCYAARCRHVYVPLICMHVYTKHVYRVKLRVKANITSGLMAASDSSALALVPLLQAEVRKLRYEQ